MFRMPSFKRTRNTLCLEVMLGGSGFHLFLYKWTGTMRSFSIAWMYFVQPDVYGSFRSLFGSRSGSVSIRETRRITYLMSVFWLDQWTLQAIRVSENTTKQNRRENKDPQTNQKGCSHQQWNTLFDIFLDMDFGGDFDQSGSLNHHKWPLSKVF